MKGFYPQNARSFLWLCPISGSPRNIPCLEGREGLGSGLIMGMTRVTICVIGAMNLLTKSP